jgi:hypothetical protein
LYLAEEVNPERAEWSLSVRKLWAGTILGKFEAEESDLENMVPPCGAATYVLLAVSRRPGLRLFT